MTCPFARISHPVARLLVIFTLVMLCVTGPEPVFATPPSIILNRPETTTYEFHVTLGSWTWQDVRMHLLEQEDYRVQEAAAHLRLERPLSNRWRLGLDVPWRARTEVNTLRIPGGQFPAQKRKTVLPPAATASLQYDFDPDGFDAYLGGDLHMTADRPGRTTGSVTAAWIWDPAVLALSLQAMPVALSGEATLAVNTNLAFGAALTQVFDASAAATIVFKIVHSDADGSGWDLNVRRPLHAQRRGFEITLGRRWTVR